MARLGEERLTGFNKLVYEYLVKSNFVKTAHVFMQEAQLGEIHINESPPTLLNWYSIFIETADVRSGKVYIPESLNRIEGIMLKLENDKQRFSRMGSSPYGQRRTSPRINEMQMRHPRGASPTLGPISPCSPKSRSPMTPFDRYDPRDMERNPGMERMSQMERTPPQPFFQQCEPLPGPTLSEEHHCNLKLPFMITLARFCPSSRILICCCAGGSMYFYNIERAEVEYDFQTPLAAINKLQILEKDDAVFMAYSYDDFSLSLCRYSTGQKENIKLIELNVRVRAFVFGGNSLYILTENSILKLYNLYGKLLKTFEIPGEVCSIDFFGNNILMIENSRVVEFDLNLNTEIKVLSNGMHPNVVVRDNHAFIIYSDLIQIFNLFSPFPVLTINTSLICKDLTMLRNGPVLCTSNEIFYGADHWTVPGLVAAAEVKLDGAPRLLVLTAQGLLLCYKSA